MKLASICWTSNEPEDSDLLKAGTGSESACGGVEFLKEPGRRLVTARGGSPFFSVLPGGPHPEIDNGSRDMLERAFGVEVGWPRRALLLARHFHPQRAVWRRNYYMSRAYRRSLTSAVKRQLTADDLDSNLLQFGAMFDAPSIAVRRTRCLSYHDGNLAQSSKCPYAPRGLSPKRVREGLAFQRDVYRGIDRIFAMSEYLRQSFIDDSSTA